MNLEPGDIFVERGKSLGAALIRFGTQSRYNHAGIVVAVTPDGYRTLEAGGKGSVWRTIPRRSGWDSVVVGLKVPDLTPLQRQRVPAVADSLHGIPYSKRGLVAIGLAQFGVRWPRWVKRRLNDKTDLFCSQLVDFALLELGYHLYSDGRLPGDVSPGDLGMLAERGWDFDVITR